MPNVGDGAWLGGQGPTPIKGSLSTGSARLTSPMRVMSPTVPRPGGHALQNESQGIGSGSPTCVPGGEGPRGARAGPGDRNSDPIGPVHLAHRRDHRSGAQRRGGTGRPEERSRRPRRARWKRGRSRLTTGFRPISEVGSRDFGPSPTHRPWPINRLLGPIGWQMDQNSAGVHIIGPACLRKEEREWREKWALHHH